MFWKPRGGRWGKLVEEAKFCLMSFSLVSSHLPPSSLAFFFFLRMSAEFVLVQGWVGWLSLLAVGSQTSGSLWWWEGGQVDSTHTAAPEILEDRFTTCQILLVAHSPH